MSKNKSLLVTPKNPSGFKDYTPEEALARKKMLQTIATVYESFGFVPLETPGVENLDTLLGLETEEEEPTAKMIFETVKLRGRETAGSSQRTALRFDLTVPLARFVAGNWDRLPKPFKRSQRANVWRGEKSQAGRFCEFMQYDADIVGCAKMIADAEIILCMYAVMKALGIDGFVIRINNRKILNELPKVAGFDPKVLSGVLRTMDKVDKIGQDGVIEELTKPIAPPVLSEEEKTKMSDEEIREYYNPPENGYGEAGLTAEQADVIRQFMNISGDSYEILNSVMTLFWKASANTEGIKELDEIAGLLDASKVPRTHWKVDLSTARGLSYYTGPIFETYLTDNENIGSVYSGGRYDGLVERFAPFSVPAVGASIGVDRLFAALSMLDKITLVPTRTKVLVCNLDPTLMKTYFSIAQELRKEGVNTEIYMGDKKGIGQQIGDANSRQIPLVIICGGREIDNNCLKIKDLTNPDRKNNQHERPLDNFVDFIKALLNK